MFFFGFGLEPIGFVPKSSGLISLILSHSAIVMAIDLIEWFLLFVSRETGGKENEIELDIERTRCIPWRPHIRIDQCVLALKLQFPRRRKRRGRETLLGKLIPFLTMSMYTNSCLPSRRNLCALSKVIWMVYWTYHGPEINYCFHLQWTKLLDYVIW